MIHLNDYNAIQTQCKCGKTHSTYTKGIFYCENAIEKIAEACKSVISFGRIGLVFDENLASYGNQCESELKKEGYCVSVFTFPQGYESTLASCDDLITSREDIRLWIALGTGTIANTVRYSAFQRGNEWICFLTAPTTDSVMYASSEFFENGVKSVFVCKPPVCVVIDQNIISNAPKECIAAGYGTLFSKLLTAFDIVFDETTSCRRCRYIAEEFKENLLDFFQTQSCEQIEQRICRSLVRIGLVTQLSGDDDYSVGVEYDCALALGEYASDKRLVGENLMLATLTSYCVYSAYLSLLPDDLYIPCDITEQLRWLDKNCNLDMINLLSERQTDCEDAAKLYVLKEYGEDLNSALNSLFSGIKGKIKQFKRLYKDAGFWLCRYVSKEDLFKVVTTACVLSKKPNLLRSIKLGGALEDCLPFDQTA